MDGTWWLGEWHPLAPLLIPPFAPIPLTAGQEDPLLSPPFLDGMTSLGLSGAFYHQVDTSRLPQTVRTTLHRRVLRQAARNMKLEETQRWCLAHLGNAGIAAVPIKGTDLLSSLTATQGERPIRDVDVLVPPANLHQAVDALLAQGCQVLHRYDPPPPLGYCHDVALITPRHRTVVELHHHFFDRLALRHAGEDPHDTFMDFFWRVGVRGETLTPAGRWLVTALRWYREGLSRGLPLRDLLAVTAAQGLPPEETLTGAAAHGLCIPLTTAWETARWLALEGPAPSPTTEHLLRLTVPPPHQLLPLPGMGFLWASRGWPARGILVRRALLPTPQQLRLSTKSRLKSPLALSWAYGRWWWNRWRP